MSKQDIFLLAGRNLAHEANQVLESEEKRAATLREHYLLGFEQAAVFVSPQNRSQQTARILLGCGKDLPEEQLHERLDERPFIELEMLDGLPRELLKGAKAIAQHINTARGVDDHNEYVTILLELAAYNKEIRRLLIEAANRYFTAISIGLKKLVKRGYPIDRIIVIGHRFSLEPLLGLRIGLKPFEFVTALLEWDPEVTTLHESIRVVDMHLRKKPRRMLRIHEMRGNGF